MKEVTLNVSPNTERGGWPQVESINGPLPDWLDTKLLFRNPGFAPPGTSWAPYIGSRILTCGSFRQATGHVSLLMYSAVLDEGDLQGRPGVLWHSLIASPDVLNIAALAKRLLNGNEDLSTLFPVLHRLPITQRESPQSPPMVGSEVRRGAIEAVAEKLAKGKVGVVKPVPANLLACERDVLGEFILNPGEIYRSLSCSLNDPARLFFLPLQYWEETGNSKLDELTKVAKLSARGYYLKGSLSFLSRG